MARLRTYSIGQLNSEDYTEYEMESEQFRRWILSEMKANNGQTKFNRLHVSEWEELQRMEQEGLIRHVPSETGFLFTLVEQPTRG